MARSAKAPLLPDVDRSRLSEQQWQICELVDQGVTVKEVAGVLRTTERSVRRQLEVIRAKNNDTRSGTPGPPGLTTALEGLSEFDTAHLTGRQQEVIGLLRDGRRTRDIARHYGITTRAARALRARASLRLTDERPEVRTYRMDGTLKAKLAERYGDRNPFRPEPSDEERVRRRRFAKSTAAWVHSLVTGDVPRGYEPDKMPWGHEAQKALGREGHGGTEARKAAGSARAKGIKVLAASSRHILTRIDSPEDRRLLEDILVKYFRAVDEGVYLEAVGGARVLLQYEYMQRSGRQGGG